MIGSSAHAVNQQVRKLGSTVKKYHRFQHLMVYFPGTGSHQRRFLANGKDRLTDGNDGAVVEATSLSVASRNPSTICKLRLEACCDDLRCMNIFCEHAGGACVCRLSRWIEQTKDKLVSLQTLSLRGNKLGQIPPSLWTLTQLEELDISGNCLQTLPPGLDALQQLRVLRMDDNLICELPEEVASLRALTTLVTDPHVDRPHHLRSLDPSLADEQKQNL